MENSLIVNAYFWKKTIRVAAWAIIAAVAVGEYSTRSYAVDTDAKVKGWSFDSSLSRSQLEEKSAKLQKEGRKIADLETYRIGRTEKIAAVWIDSEKDEKWVYKDGMTIATLKGEHSEHIAQGYVINEIEVVRVGANLEFSAVWTKAPEQEQTLFFWGMDDLLFSNRYGEMADRGYRLQDIEVYEASGKTFHAAIWKARKPETSVRFYRGLDEKEFSEVSRAMAEKEFRMVDVEGYVIDGDLRFAASWEALAQGQEAKYETSLLVDVFYQKNADYISQGYRLIDFDTYSKSVNELRYAGCWVKEVEVEGSEDDKNAFIEAFRISKAD